MILRHLPPLPTVSTAPRTPEISSSVPPFVSVHPPPRQPPPSSTPPRRPIVDRNPSSPYFFPSPPPDGPDTFSNSLSAAITSLSGVRVQEHELTSAQRRRIRYAHGKIRLYDLGWKVNLREAIGGGWSSGKGWKWWLRLVVSGGSR